MEVETLLREEFSPEILLLSIYLETMAFPEDAELTEGQIGIGPPIVEMAMYVLVPFFGNEWNCIPSYDLIQKLKKIIQSELYAPMRMKFSDIEALRNKKPIDHLLDQVRINKRIVRGEGYPQQTKQQIVDILYPYNAQFETMLGVSPQECVSIAEFIFEQTTENINELKTRVFSDLENDYDLENVTEEQAPEVESRFYETRGSLIKEILPIKTKLIKDQLGITQDKFEMFCQIFSICKNIGLIAEFEEVQKHPLIEFEDSVLLLDMNIFLDQIFYFFDQKSKVSSFYQRYQNHRGRYLENKINSILSHFFPGAVKETLDYPDLDKSENATTELDLMIVFEPYIFLIEAKSNQYRFESQMGNIARFRTDLKNNLFDAYEQALRAKDYIERVNEPIFRVRKTGEEIKIDKSKYTKYILCTVSLNFLSSIATKLSSLQSSGLFNFKKDLPWSICLVELDIIKRFIKSRSLLLHYVERRLDLQRKDQTFVSDEVDYIGCYLQSLLNIEFLGFDPKEKNASAWLAGQHNIIDAAMGAYGNKEDPELSVALPGHIKDLIQFLELKLPDKNNLRIIYELLDNHPSLLKQLDNVLEKVRNEDYQIGKFKRAMIRLGNLLVIVAGTKSHLKEELIIYCKSLMTPEKYKQRVFTTIGIMMIPTLAQPFVEVSLIEGPWRFDKELDEMVNDTNYKNFDMGKREKVGRNDPCPCKSGAKFKRCHGKQ